MTGRKNKYEPDTFPLLAEEFAREGLTDEEIACKLSIRKSSFYLYQNQHPEFKEAIKRGKRPVDVEVENSLLKRALGFEYTEKTTEVDVAQNGHPSVTRIKETRRQIPGDVGAIAFWLKNRRPDKWRDFRQYEHSGDVKLIKVTRR